jgi:signal transduction histidine kinase/ActR/RegA family two-component response regulator
MFGRRSLILVQRPEVQEQLTAMAEGLPWVPARGLSFHAATGDVHQLITEWRQRQGDLPIGFLAEDEPMVLTALAAGADEAAVFTQVDASALAAFVDRLELRARLRAETQRLHETFANTEKLTALGTLVAGVGHEINNPLSAMMLSIEAARRHVLPQLEASWEITRAISRGEPVPKSALQRIQQAEQCERLGRDAARLFDDISSAADSIASIVRDLRIFARTDQEEPPELVDLTDLVDHAIRLVGREVFQHGLLERDYTPGLPKLVVPRNRVTQVFMNVLINAAHAIREVSRPVHRVRVSTRADEDFLAVSISDTGPGIPEDSLERIFDPFFTTRRAELGTGLGLAISRSILRRLGGDLIVESVYGNGATFICLLPIPTREAIKEAYKRATISKRSIPPRAASSVLLVDDDERVLRSYVRLLNPDYRIVIAQDASDAIELLESGSTPDVLVLELDLPAGDGPMLLNWVAQHRPLLAQRTLIVTAAAGKASYGEYLASSRCSVLHKPVRGDELLSAINQLLERKEA